MSSGLFISMAFRRPRHLRARPARRIGSASLEQLERTGGQHAPRPALLREDDGAQVLAPPALTDEHARLRLERAVRLGQDAELAEGAHDADVAELAPGVLAARDVRREPALGHGEEHVDGVALRLPGELVDL